jgi:hypothetical protein
MRDLPIGVIASQRRLLQPLQVGQCLRRKNNRRRSRGRCGRCLFLRTSGLGLGELPRQSDPRANERKTANAKHTDIVPANMSSRNRTRRASNRPFNVDKIAHKHIIALHPELMNSVRFIFIALTLFPGSSFAGEVYGTIKEGDKPVDKGTALEIKSTAKTYPAVTDEFGNYRVVVAEPGTCEITIHFKDQSISGEIQSYWNPSRFDWALEKSGEKYSLKRQ